MHNSNKVKPISIPQEELEAIFERYKNAIDPIYQRISEMEFYLQNPDIVLSGSPNNLEGFFEDRVLNKGLNHPRPGRVLRHPAVQYLYDRIDRITRDYARMYPALFPNMETFPESYYSNKVID